MPKTRTRRTMSRPLKRGATQKQKMLITSLPKTKMNNINISKKVNIEEEVKLRENVLGKYVGFNRFEDIYEKSAEYSKSKVSKNAEQSLIKLLQKQTAPTKYNPRTNFYQYINYEWLTEADKTYKHEYFVELDSFRIAQDKVYVDMIGLIKDYISANKTTEKGRLVKNVYNSLYRLDERIAQKHVNDTVQQIDDIIAEDNLWKLMAEINKDEIVSWSSPISWRVSPDLKHSDTFRNYVGPGQTSLYDVFMYLPPLPDASPEKINYNKQVHKRFLGFIDEMFDACLGKNHGLLSTDVFDVEKEIVDMFICDKIKHEDPDGYNVVHASDCLEKYGFDWAQFTKYMGFQKKPEWFIVSSLNYLTCCCKTLSENWKTPKWRTYWIYLYLKQIIRFHKSWRKIYYDFFNNFIRGQEVMFPNDIYPIFGMSATFNTLISVLYLAKNKNQVIIDYVNNMAHDLKTVFTRIIRRNKWMLPSTKKAALKKLETMELMVGHPPVLLNDVLLNYDEHDAWGNMVLVSDYRTKIFMKLDGQPVFNIPTFDWNLFKMTAKQCYVVNCFYLATENRIYIPMGYLQEPFVDLGERGIEYNLAHVGYALAHELSHSLDTTGGRFDYKGNMKSWWSPADHKIFDKKVKDIVTQYETFAARDNITFDAEVGTGEDMADISGLAICVEYLRDFHDYVKTIIPMRKLSFERFFAQIAIQGRQKVNKQALASELKINPHPLEEYRVNCGLARLKLFQSMYNVKKGDNMYWPNMDTIW